MTKTNETFDILNPDTWNLADENTPLVYNGQVILNDKGKFIKTLDFIHFLQSIAAITKNTEIEKSAIERLMKRMIDRQIESSKEPLPLTPETEDKTESGFTPHDESTWNLASDRRMIKVHGTRLVKDGKYVSEKQFIDEVRGIFKYISYKNPDANIQDFAKNQLEFDFSIYAEKDLEPVFTVNGFSFSKALCDCCRDIEKETLEKVADAMNFCIKQNYKKYQYKQHFFYDRIPASQEFFVEIYFAEKYKTRKDVDDLISAFYMEFEPETKEEIDAIIGGSLYLSAHKELIPPIEEYLLTRYF